MLSQVTVVLPDRSPPSLTHRCADLGADVVLFGETLEDVINYAKKANRDENQILLRFFVFYYYNVILIIIIMSFWLHIMCLRVIIYASHKCL